MPAIVEFAKKHWVWIAGAAAVLLLLWLRSRQQAAAQPADTGGGGQSFGAGATGASAPASVPDSQGDQLAQLQANVGQAQLDVYKAMSQLQLQGIQQQLDFTKATQPAQEQLQNQIYQTQAAHEKELGGASADFCPAGTSMRLDPNTGQYVCRNKSGGLAFIGQITSSIQNVFSGFTSGVAAAAPGIGAGAANAAASYYTGRLFGPSGVGMQAYPGSPTPGGGGTVVAPPGYGPGQMSGGSFPATPGIAPTEIQYPKLS